MVSSCSRLLLTTSQEWCMHQSPIIKGFKYLHTAGHASKTHACKCIPFKDISKKLGVERWFELKPNVQSFLLLTCPYFADMFRLNYGWRQRADHLLKLPVIDDGWICEEACFQCIECHSALEDMAPLSNGLACWSRAQYSERWLLESSAALTAWIGVWELRPVIELRTYLKIGLA